MKLVPSIGLEIHAQIKTASKMFCPCPIDFHAPPNTLICPVCLGHPGTLPAVNRRALEIAVKVALALSCRINLRSIFARKNYFYPDLPKGYQITQFSEPLAVEGMLQSNTGRSVRIRRVHLEEDAGKLLHSEGEEGPSFIDFNRCGIPLIEIVTEPDIGSPEEAAEFLKALRDLLLYLEVSACSMEEGDLRCDANISLSEKGSLVMGEKVEIKNLNSFRFLERALACEVERQAGAIQRGESILHETRLFDERSGLTLPMRTKEAAIDYRYFPEPDLLTLEVEESLVKRWRDELPELPGRRVSRMAGEYGIPLREAKIIASDKSLADFFEGCAKIYKNYRNLTNWFIRDFLRELKASGKPLGEIPVTEENLTELLSLVDRGEISMKTAGDIFPDVFHRGMSPKGLIRERGLTRIDGEEEIQALIDSVLAERRKEVGLYLAGKRGLFGLFVGEVMKRSKGRAHPGLVNELLGKTLQMISAKGEE